MQGFVYKFINVYLFGCLIIATMLALGGVSPEQYGTYLQSALKNSNDMMREFTFKIPNIPTIPLLEFLPTNNFWLVVLNVLLFFVNVFFGFLNGVISVLNFAITLINFLIQLIQFLVIVVTEYVINLVQSIINNSATTVVSSL